jgi:diguanylate cyclase (GGDEF)-like protein
VEEDLDRAFWQRHARAAHSLDLVIVVINTAYILATFTTGPHRPLLLTINLCGFAGIVSAIAMVPEQRIATSAHRDLIFGMWCVSGSLLITVAAWLDGGTNSPLAWLFPLSVMFTASVHRPRLVLWSAGTGLCGYLAVAIAHGAFESHPAMMFVQAGYLTALAYAAAVTAHFRWTDYDARVELTERLSSQADRDGLTGLLNHRAFHEHLEREVAQSERADSSLAVLLVDADHFKSVNDEHGHLVGDEVLKALASVLVRETRAGDLCARIGGEEFCVALPHTTRREALDVAERIRAAVATMGAPAAVTVSIGVRVAHPNAETVTALIEQADAALYEAKDRGRNRVCERAAA